MTDILDYIIAAAVLTIIIAIGAKSLLHFRFLRIKQGKSGSFSDYVNIGYSFSKGINYAEIILPIPIVEKEESEQLETLRKRINAWLATALISLVLIIIISAVAL